MNLIYYLSFKKRIEEAKTENDLITIKQDIESLDVEDIEIDLFSLFVEKILKVKG